jgi:hypothetical protein
MLEAKLHYRRIEYLQDAGTRMAALMVVIEYWQACEGTVG